MSTLTPNLGLSKPADADTSWGDEYRGAMDIVDANPGIKLVADASARLALTPFKGQTVLQLDTGVKYQCTNATGPVWKALDVASNTLTTKGDLLVYGSELSRLGVGIDGQVLTADAAQALGVKWATPAGGSGGGLERWNVSAGTDLGYDDEFNDGNINAAWVAVDQVGYVNNWYEVAGIKGLSAYFPSGRAAYTVSGLLRPLGSMSYPCYIETAVKIDSTNWSYPSAGLIFADGVTLGTGHEVDVGYIASSAILNRSYHAGYNSRTSYVDCSVEPYPARDRVYIRLVWSAVNTFSTYMSPDGVVWFLCHGAATLSLTPTHFGLMQSSHNNSSAPYVANFAYFRARSGSPANG